MRQMVFWTFGGLFLITFDKGFKSLNQIMSDIGNNNESLSIRYFTYKTHVSS